MGPLFHYQTFQVSLNKETRSLTIKLNKCEEENFINLEMLFELESLLQWLQNKVEINTVLLSSAKHCFSKGIDQKNLSKFSENQILKINQKLQNILYAITRLPQTVVADIKNGMENIACDLVLACDLRIGSEQAKCHFNHTTLGFTSFNCGFISNTLGKVHAQHCLMGAPCIEGVEAKQRGVLTNSYASESEGEQLISELLMAINQQSAISRIQTKLALKNADTQTWQTMSDADRQVARPSLLASDWQKGEDMKAKSMGYAVKLSLVKTDSNELRN